MLNDGVRIVDCPGLVFPNIVHSKDELVINGILPIDQLKDYLSPIKALLGCFDSPLSVFEFYNLKKDEAMCAKSLEDISLILLEKYATLKGFRTSVVGNPDNSRAARLILKDFVAGKLLYCHSPPSEE